MLSRFVRREEKQAENFEEKIQKKEKQKQKNQEKEGKEEKFEPKSKTSTRAQKTKRSKAKTEGNSGKETYLRKMAHQDRLQIHSQSQGDSKGSLQGRRTNRSDRLLEGDERPVQLYPKNLQYKEQEGGDESQVFSSRKQALRLSLRPFSWV